MDQVIPMSWLNQILLIGTSTCILLCLIIDGWLNLSSLSIYVSISWAIITIILSIWLSCLLLRLTLKLNKPIQIQLFNSFLSKALNALDQCFQPAGSNHITCLNDLQNQIKNRSHKDVKDGTKFSSIGFTKMIDIDHLVEEISSSYIEIWYNNISQDSMFPEEAKNLLKKFLSKFIDCICSIDKIQLMNKLADVLLIHLKEYRRALRRVEKRSISHIEEAYKYSHPGIRSSRALEHTIHHMVIIFAKEFLQWELTSSPPCKLLLSILSKRILTLIDTFSNPAWIFGFLLGLCENMTLNTTIKQSKHEQKNGTVLVALSNGITSVTAPVIPRPLPQSLSKSSPTEVTIIDTVDTPLVNVLKPTLDLKDLTTEHRGLWGNIGVSEMDAEIDEDRISPVYEEPTDFASTIARLRSVLQQKSTTTTPLHIEERSYAVYEGNQFINLSIPWTEFHTAPDGSQQLFYCIQFDDIEQHGVDQFESTTATVRRQYSDFVQLHLCLEETSSLSSVMSELVLPEGGRSELENYLKTLCTRLSGECPSQLRHFLRPSISSGKKADAVTPRFDKFLAKTVSGVFNTLRTVVPGFEIDQEEEELPLPTLMPLADVPWKFVEDIKSMSLASELQQLITERIDYCNVDTAYEAVDSIEGNGDSELLTHWWETVNCSYDEELEELDSNLSFTCVFLDLICEVLAGIGSTNALQQEVVIKWTKLFFGDVTEPIIRQTILWMFDNLNNRCTTFNQPNHFPEPDMVAKENLLKILNNQIPKEIKSIFGEKTIQDVMTYLLGCFEAKKMNLDFNMQVLNTLASQLLISNRKS